MLKLKVLINVLLILTILFCLHPINISFAGDCSDKGDGAGTPTVAGDYNYTDSWFSNIQFDPGNPDEIDQNDAITISIIGGCSRYTWSVNGNGFSLAESQTTGLTNTLIADDTACGAATITVTGCGGQIVTGHVRCTADSQWVLKGTGCNSILEGYEANGFDLINVLQYYPTATYGKYKQVVHCNYQSTTSDSGCDTGDAGWYAVMLALIGCGGQEPPVCINFEPPCTTLYANWIQCGNSVHCAYGNCYWTPGCDPHNVCNVYRTNYTCGAAGFYEWECY
jgi:hypothetical protein